MKSAFRYTIRKRRRLAPAAGAPRCTATCACHPWHSDPDKANAAATATSDAASAASASGAAATTTACAEAATASARATTSATAASAASARQLHACDGDIFVVEETEGGEADVGKFLFTERDYHAGCEIRPLLDIAGRYGRCRCASRQRKSQSGSSERRYGGSGYSLLFRSLLQARHNRILQRCKGSSLE